MVIGSFAGVLQTQTVVVWLGLTNMQRVPEKVAADAGPAAKPTPIAASSATLDAITPTLRSSFMRPLR
jgi:hypothetical protein